MTYSMLLKQNLTSLIIGQLLQLHLLKLTTAKDSEVICKMAQRAEAHQRKEDFMSAMEATLMMDETVREVNEPLNRFDVVASLALDVEMANSDQYRPILLEEMFRWVGQDQEWHLPSQHLLAWHHCLLTRAIPWLQYLLCKLWGSRLYLGSLYRQTVQAALDLLQFSESIKGVGTTTKRATAA
jgi:hypothetical protein